MGAGEEGEEVGDGLGVSKISSHKIEELAVKTHGLQLSTHQPRGLDDEGSQERGKKLQKSQSVYDRHNIGQTHMNQTEPP